MTDPAPPEGVRVRLADGSEHDCDLLYLGVNDEGLHEWRASVLLPGPAPTSRTPFIPDLLADVIPGRTTVHVEVRWAG